MGCLNDVYVSPMKTQYDSYIQTAAIKTDSTGYFYGEIRQGYAELTAALIRSLGIPCKIVAGYGGILNYTDWSKVPAGQTNHAWNEAFVNGIWAILDTTWDSGNSFSNGTYTKGTKGYTYFDPTIKYFSIDHRISS